MDGLLVAIIVGDAVGGFACLRYRRVRHALGLGGVLVPLSLLLATVAFAALARPPAPPQDRTELLVLAYGAILVAIAGVGWMLATAMAAAWRARLERPRRRH